MRSGCPPGSIFSASGSKTEDVENVIIASVVPQVIHTLTNAMVKYFGKTPIIVDEDVDPGLPYGVSGDERLGADRSVACLQRWEIRCAAGGAGLWDSHHRGCGQPWGRLYGRMHHRGDSHLRRRAFLCGRLCSPKVELVKPETVLGCTAVGQIQAGTVLGYIGAMEYLIRMAKEELARPTPTWSPPEAWHA